MHPLTPCPLFVVNSSNPIPSLVELTSIGLSDVSVVLGVLGDFFGRTHVVCPNTKSPTGIPDEVGVEIGDAQVVDGLVLTRVLDLLDPGPNGTAALRRAGAAVPPSPARPRPAGFPCARPWPSRRPAASTGPRRRPG